MIGRTVALGKEAHETYEAYLERVRQAQAHADADDLETELAREAIAVARVCRALDHAKNLVSCVGGDVVALARLVLDECHRQRQWENDPLKNVSDELGYIAMALGELAERR